MSVILLRTSALGGKGVCADSAVRHFGVLTWRPGFKLVPSTFAFREQADVQYFLSNESCEVDGLAVTASAWLDFRHRKSVPRTAGRIGLATPRQDL